MSRPNIDISVSIDVNSTVGDPLGAEYKDSITASYDVTLEIVNDNSKVIEIFRSGETVAIFSSASGSYIDEGFSLPNFQSYYARYVGSEDILFLSVNNEHFSGVIDDLLLESSIDSGTPPPSAPTEMGIPVVSIQYDGPSLTQYTEDRFSSELNIVPFFIDPGLEVEDVIDFPDYIQQDNTSLLISYDENVSLTHNGFDFKISDGYVYLSKFNAPGTINLSSLYIMIKKTGVIGSGLMLNIYSGSGAPSASPVATSFISHSDIPDEFNIVEFELDSTLSITEFFIEIIPLNTDSQYSIALSNLSFTSVFYASRYTRIFKAAGDEGFLYTTVLTTKLDAIYGAGLYPLIVVDSDVSVVLNKLYKEVFSFPDGFDGPCIVSYPTINLLQVSDMALSFGPGHLETSGQLSSAISLIQNYNAIMNIDIDIESSGLYSEFKTASVSNPSDTSISNIDISGFQSPDGNSSVVVLRTSSIYIKYSSVAGINLNDPVLGDNGEWFPAISSGFVPSVRYKIGDTVFVFGYGDDTVIAVSTDSIELDVNGVISNPLSYSINAPLDYPVIEVGESPVQLSETVFQVKKYPLYTDINGDISVTIAIGDKYEKDITSLIKDWDPDNSIIELSRPIKFKESVFIKYLYIESSVIVPIDMRTFFDSSFDLYLGSNGAIVYKDSSLISYVESGVLYLRIGSYSISTLTAPEDIDIIDVRNRGGGLKESIDIDEALAKNIGSVGFYDIGFYDGMNIPQMVLSAKIPRKVLNRIEDPQVEEIIHIHADAATKIYKEYVDEYIEPPPSGGVILLENDNPLLLENGNPIELEQDI